MHVHLHGSPRHPPIFHRSGSPIGRDRRAFDAAPHAYLLVDRDFRIVDANAAYLTATMTDADRIVRREMFEIFPDNPGAPEAQAVAHLTASFHEVMSTRRTHAMLLQRYDIRNLSGAFEERYWRPCNTPLLDDNGEVEFILHHVADVTEFVTGNVLFRPAYRALTRRRT